MYIESAIENFQRLVFRYEGFSCEVEPHCLGIDKKGRHILKAFQVSGGSELNEYVGWKIFDVNEMRYVFVSVSKFSGPRADYKKDDAAFVRIDAQL